MKDLLYNSINKLLYDIDRNKVDGCFYLYCFLWWLTMV